MIKKCAFIVFLFFLGCSPVEISRLFGVGTAPFKTEGKIYSFTCNQDIFTCYNEIEEGLKSLKVDFYRGSRRKNFIIATNFNRVFPSCSSSTEVAVFFTETGKLKTKVEVSSLNHNLSEFAAAALWDYFEEDRVCDFKEESFSKSKVEKK
ncbi:MAG: hypothetical protein PHU64_00045 [Candidatus Omnitrophica bacterium]|nr:hypothetical protein [Candidatus Omnitrophota bacterium]MDD5430448.1 hypothetical protein [Candidatus Omnitrophota bacterium]